MSRLAKKPIAVPEGVTVTRSGGAVVVTGQKGELRVPLLPFTDLAVESAGVMVRATEEKKQARANQGTLWSLTKNAIEGVHQGFSKVLEIEGVGYRAQMDGTTLALSLGYVNPVRVPIPADIAISVEKNVITVSGADKELVGRIASQIRALKKPEPYKGKGIHYRGEVIRRKVGKKAATVAAT